MKAASFAFFVGFLHKASGLALGPGKEYLVEGRLQPLAQSWGLPGIDDLANEVRSRPQSALARAVAEALTTNETSFFRDPLAWEDLKLRVLPQLIAARANEQRLRIWCAAASTGQEPYSMALLLRDSLPVVHDWDVQIWASDIADSMLARARAGFYTQFEVQRGLPAEMLARYFEPAPLGWRVQSDLRSQITWRQLNLIQEFADLGPFDLILCRNVLLYFDRATKASLVGRLQQVLRPDGCLLLGAAETLLGLDAEFARRPDCHTAVYALSPGEPGRRRPTQPTGNERPTFDRTVKAKRAARL